MFLLVLPKDVEITQGVHPALPHILLLAYPKRQAKNNQTGQNLFGYLDCSAFVQVYISWAIQQRCRTCKVLMMHERASLRLVVTEQLPCRESHILQFLPIEVSSLLSFRLQLECRAPFFGERHVKYLDFLVSVFFFWFKISLLVSTLEVEGMFFLYHHNFMYHHI